MSALVTRLALALVFGVAGVAKLVAPITSSAAELASGLGPLRTPAFVYTLSAVEIVLAALLLSPRWRVAAWGALALTTGFLRFPQSQDSWAWMSSTVAVLAMLASAIRVTPGCS